MAANYNANNAASNSILSNVTNSLTPILEAGPSQKGFSTAEDTELQSGAAVSNAANYQHASAVAGANNAAGGGSTYAPTGGQQQVAGAIASNAAGNLSSTQNQIEEANWAQGTKNFENAEAGELGAQQGYNPNATGSLAENANSNSFGQQQQMAQQSDAWVGDLSSLVGGLGGAALGNLNAGPFGKKP